MTLYELYDLTAYIAGKFPQGGALPPGRFNMLLSQVQSEYYDKCWRELVVNPDLLSVTPLLPFKKTSTLTVAADGTATLPGDFADYITLYTVAANDVTMGISTIRFRKADIVNDELFNRRRSSVFTRADVTPFAKITHDGITMVPSDVAAAELDYLRSPATPLMDYCTYTANPSAVIYMPPTSRFIEGNTPGTYNLYIGTTKLAEGVTKTSVVMDGYVSTTVELEWNEKDQWVFVYLILAKCAINLAQGEAEKFALMMSK